MKKTLFVGAALLLLLTLASPQAISSAHTAPQSAEKYALAYYFYWYQYPNHHFIDPDGSDALTDHPPSSYLISPPAYSYGDAGWHYRELTDLMEAGVDYILPVYWGDYTNTYWSQSGLTKLVEAENTLIGEGKSPPKIGMFYDTTALEVQNGGTPPDLTTLAGKQLFYGMIKDFFIRVPNHSMWARMDGKVIIYLYVSPYISTYNQSTFDYVYTQFATDFSGEVPYIVRETSWTGVTTDGAYSWGAAVNGPSFAGALAAVGPGYNDSAVYGRTPTIRSRECGEFYQDSWEQVIDSSATLAAIETWNEFHEGTDVSASAEYGRQYIEMTAQNIAAWKASNPSARTYVWIDLGRFSYSQGLRAPNGGDGTWMTVLLAGRQAAYPDPQSTPDASNHIYLNVDDAYILGQGDVATHVWVTVEYFDSGTDDWFLQYDSVGSGLDHYFKVAGHVTLQNTGTWKRVTFDLPDAYFANREQDGLADLRLVDGYDGTTNYFGRVWVLKSNPSSLHAPNLTGLDDMALSAGQSRDILFTPSDPGGGTLTVSLGRAPDFVTLINNGNGSYTLRLRPHSEDAGECDYRVRLLVTDNTSPATSDAVTIAVHVYPYALFLPAITR